MDESLLAALAAAGSQPRPRRSVSGARLALVSVALVQLAVTVPMLILGSDGGAPVHVAHEMGSFDAALAVGFLVAAWRPALASGIGMLVGVAALLLATTAAIDLVGGRTTLGNEAPHLLAIAGWLLLRRVAAHPLTPQSSSGSGLIEVLRRREQPAVVNLVRGGRR